MSWKDLRYKFVKAPEHPKNHKGQVREHVLIAEKALGHYLPERAIVHHADEDIFNNVPSNLVICENRAYHSRLHARIKSLKNTGNTHSGLCYCCKEWKPISEFYILRKRNSIRCSICKTCNTIKSRERRLRNIP